MLSETKPDFEPKKYDLVSPENYCPIHSDGKCRFNFSTETEKKCFIAMAYEQPYSKDIEKILRKGVESVVKAEPILAKDAEGEKGSTPMYCETVCKLIKESHYCIVDITYHSVNVGIEFGVALQMGKDVIITKFVPVRSKNIKDKEEDILEDLAENNCIQYFKLPAVIPTDIAGLTIRHYKNQGELNRELRKKFPPLPLSR